MTLVTLFAQAALVCIVFTMALGTFVGRVAVPLLGSVALPTTQFSMRATKRKISVSVIKRHRVKIGDLIVPAAMFTMAGLAGLAGHVG